MDLRIICTGQINLLRLGMHPNSDTEFIYFLRARNSVEMHSIYNLAETICMEINNFIEDSI